MEKDGGSDDYDAHLVLYWMGCHSYPSIIDYNIPSFVLTILSYKI